MPRITPARARAGLGPARVAFAAFAAATALATAMPAAAATPAVVPVAVSGRPAPHDPAREWAYFGHVGINNAGQIVLTASVREEGGSPTSGVWLGPWNNLQNIAGAGNPLPGLASDVGLRLFDPPALNDRGEVAFNAFLTGVFDANDDALWRYDDHGLRLVARAYDPAPGMPAGAKFINIHAFALGNGGRLAFKAYTWYGSPPVHHRNNQGIWFDDGSGASLLIREGDPAPGFGPDHPFHLDLDHQYHPLVAGDGHVAFWGQTYNPEGFPSGRWSANPDRVGGTGGSGESGGVRPVALQGVPLDGLPDGMEFLGGYVGGDIAHGDTHVFPATTTLGSTLLRRVGDGPAEVLAHGQVPGREAGVRLGSIFDVYTNNTGDVAFTAFLSDDFADGNYIGDDNNRGLFRKLDGHTLELLAATGDHAPGAPEGVLFDAFDPDAGSPQQLGQLAFNNAGQIAFLASLRGAGVHDANDLALYLTDPEGNPHLLARTGDAAPLAPLDPLDTPLITDIRLALGAGPDDGRLRALNDDGTLAYILQFSDGRHAVFLANLTTPIPEPATATLLLATTLALTLRRRR